MMRTKEILVLVTIVFIEAILNGYSSITASTVEAKTTAAITISQAEMFVSQVTANTIRIPKITISGKLFHDIDHNFVEGIAYGIEVPYSDNYFYVDESNLPLADITLCASYEIDDEQIESCSEIGPERSYQISLPLLRKIDRLTMKMEAPDYLNWTVVTGLEYTESEAAYERTIILPGADVHRIDEVFEVDTIGQVDLVTDFALTRTDLIIPIPSQYLHHVHEIGLFDREFTDRNITQIFTGESFTQSNCTLYQNSVAIDSSIDCGGNHPAIDFFVDDDTDPVDLTNQNHVPVINPYIGKPGGNKIDRFGTEYANEISIPVNDIHYIILMHHVHYDKEEGIFEVNEEDGVSDQTDIIYGSVLGIIDGVGSQPPIPHTHMGVIEFINSTNIFHDPIMESVVFKEKVDRINNKTYADYERASNLSMPELTLEGYTMQNGRLVIFAPTFEMRDADGSVIEIPIELYQEIVE